MFDPFHVYHSSINASTNDPPNSNAPRLFSTLDYFVQYSKDLFESEVLRKWSEMGTTDSSDEEFYHIPDMFYRETAFQVLLSLPEARQRDVEQDAMSANHAMLLPYYESQLRELFKDKMSLHGDKGTLRTVANILRPIITALESVTNLKILGFAGGCNDNEIGAIMMSTKRDSPPEPPIIFPKSQTDIFRRAAQDWISKPGTKTLEEWVTNTHPSKEIQSIAAKRKNPPDDYRHFKKPRKTHDSDGGVTNETITTNDMSIGNGAHASSSSSSRGQAFAAQPATIERHSRFGFIPHSSTRFMTKTSTTVGVKDTVGMRTKETTLLSPTRSTSHAFSSSSAELARTGTTKRYTLRRLSLPAMDSRRPSLSRMSPSVNETTGNINTTFQSQASSTTRVNLENMNNTNWDIVLLPKPGIPPTPPSPAFKNTGLGSEFANSNASMLRTPFPPRTLPNSTSILPFSAHPVTSSISHDSPTTQNSSTLDEDRLNSRSRSVRVRDVSNSAKMAEKSLEKVFKDEECRRHYFDLMQSIPHSASYLRRSLVPIVKNDLGPLFRDLLRKLIRREALCKFSTHFLRRTCPILMGKRPPEIAHWIKVGTGRCGAEVAVNDTVDFSKRWSAWWEDVQPRWDWRTPEKHFEDSYPSKAEQLTDQDHKHWTSLRNSAGNILVNLVAALHGWGLAVQKGSPHAEINDESWLCAVKDCSLLMDLLIKSIEKDHAQELTGEGSQSISTTA